MDPLSITSAVVGLLTATAKIYTLLETISSIRNAPSAIKDAQNDLRHTEITLRSIQRLLQRIHVMGPRRELIQIDDLRITLADAMMALDAFELMLQRIAGLARVRVSIAWTKYVKELAEHLAKMSRYQQSLMLMISILQCESDMEAYQSQEKLQIVIETVLTENTILRQKLLDSDPSGAHSIATRRQDDDTSTIRGGRDNDDNSTIRGKGVARSNTTSSVRSRLSTFGGGIIQFAFENILEQSRVYKKMAHVHECDRSFASTAARSHAWSAFTGYSLADISVLSVIAMPLACVDMSNGKYYQIPEKDETLREPDQVPGAGMKIVTDVDGFGRSVREKQSEDSDGRKTPTQEEIEEDGRATPTQSTFADNNPIKVTSPDTPTRASSREAALIENMAAETAKSSRSGKEVTQGDEESASSSSANPTSTSELVSNSSESSSDQLSRDSGYDSGLALEEEVIFPCKGCGEILEEGKAFELAGNRWHMDCFRCNTCDVQLDSNANLLLLGDGSLICNNCTYSCAVCGNKIEDLAILAEDQAWCAGCFRCRNCSRKIEDLRYARTSQGIFCMHCHDALMTARRMRFRGLPALPKSKAHNEEYPYRVQALWGYQASPDDLDELSFAQGEVLALTNLPDWTEEWWQARRANGEIGLVDSRLFDNVFDEIEESKPGKYLAAPLPMAVRPLPTWWHWNRYEKVATALFSYQASPDEGNDMSFSQGDVLEIANSDGLWWPARKKNGEFGMVPKNYFRLDGAADGAKSTQPQGAPARQEQDNPPPAPSSPLLPLSSIWTEHPYRIRALFDYKANAEDPNEISFAKGEILEAADVTGKWWPARKENGEIGIVPRNYFLTEGYPSPMILSTLAATT